MQRSAEEVTEIERHKYFLSERKGYDVGWEFAEEDWDQRHSAEWREAHQPLPSPCDLPTQGTTTCCQQGIAPAAGAGRSVAPNVANSSIRRADPGKTDDRRPLRWLFTRLFQQRRTS